MPRFTIPSYCVRLIQIILMYTKMYNPRQGNDSIYQYLKYFIYTQSGTYCVQILVLLMTVLFL
jgi:hypothetical protein